MHACDLSPRAVDFVKAHDEYNTDDCHAFQCDLSKDDVLEHIEPESCDIVTALFVLSAMSLDEMKPALANVVKASKRSSVSPFFACVWFNLSRCWLY